MLVAIEVTRDDAMRREKMQNLDQNYKKDAEAIVLFVFFVSMGVYMNLYYELKKNK